MSQDSPSAPGNQLGAPYPLPRVTIQFCTQCKWMLRAAYFAQELLSTFSTSLGEVALQPSTGGTFVVEILFSSSSPPPPPTIITTTTTAADPDADPSSSTEEDGSNPRIQRRVLWDRRVDGGFPETKELKRRVRDAIEPGRNLGHVDRDHTRPSKAVVSTSTPTQDAQSQPVAARGEKDGTGEGGGGSKQVCEDCQ